MEANGIYTAQDWISSKMKLLDDDGILACLAERGIEPSVPFASLSRRDRDLLLAEGLLSQILLCGTGQTVKDTDGNYSHSEGGWQITKADKTAWENLYNALRRKWGEDSLIPTHGIRMHTSGIRLWRRI